MKSVAMFVFGILSLTCLFAAGLRVSESPWAGVGTPTTIAISSSTFTKVPSSQLSGRFGVYVSNPAGNLGLMIGHLGDCSSTAIASSVRPFVLSTVTVDSYSYFFPIREDVCLWLITTSTITASQNVHYQEVKP